MSNPTDLMERAAKALKVFTGHDSHQNLKHHYGEKWWEPMQELRDELLAAVASKAPGWRCFHCDEVFTDERCARDHFGADETREPACRIKMGAERSMLTALRRAEADAADAWFKIHNEATDSAKAFYAQGARHQEQLRATEELGYERGLRDAARDSTWRDDAFERAAAIVERWFGDDARGCAGDIRALITGNAGKQPGLSDAEQKAQGARCGCRGADDMCPCQNVPDATTRRERAAGA